MANFQKFKPHSKFVLNSEIEVCNVKLKTQITRKKDLKETTSLEPGKRVNFDNYYGYPVHRMKILFSDLYSTYLQVSLQIFFQDF